MTDKEKILAEIERLKEVFVPTVNEEYRDFTKFLLDFVIDSINSLPTKEQNDDLKDEIKLYQLHNPVINHQEKSLNDFIGRVAIYFANWQKQQTIKKACEWIVDHVNDSLYYDEHDIAFVDIEELITAFKEYMEDE